MMYDVTWIIIVKFIYNGFPLHTHNKLNGHLLIPWYISLTSHNNNKNNETHTATHTHSRQP